MFIEVMNSKIHRATVTDANLNYIGSITIDGSLMDASGILENQKVQVLNLNNGARIETYAIRGEEESGVICLNGAAAHHFNIGDTVIIIAYASIEYSEAKSHKPTVVHVDKSNRAI